MSDEKPQPHDVKPHAAGHTAKGGHGHGGGGGHEEGHEGAPEWLISFADNVALLMGFFVILLAMNMKEPTSGGIGGKDEHGGAPETSDRILDMAIAIREAFNSPVDMASTSANDQPLIRRILERRAEGEAKDPGADGNREEVQSIRPGDYFSLGGAVIFDENSSTLSGASVESARAIAKIARGQNVILEIRGHASAAEAFREPDRGMRISFERALAVASALEDGGVEWGAIRVIACGDNDRLVPLAYETQTHRTNQRAEVYITNQPRPEDPHTKDPAAAAPPPGDAKGKSAAAPVPH